MCAFGTGGHPAPGRMPSRTDVQTVGEPAGATARRWGQACDVMAHTEAAPRTLLEFAPDRCEVLTWVDFTPAYPNDEGDAANQSNYPWEAGPCG